MAPSSSVRITRTPENLRCALDGSSVPARCLAVSAHRGDQVGLLAAGAPLRQPDVGHAVLLQPSSWLLSPNQVVASHGRRTPVKSISSHGVEQRDLDRLLALMARVDGSDLLIKAGAQPRMRIDGDLRLLQDEEAFSAEEMELLVETILPARMSETFEKHHEVDFAYSVPSLGRFRVNAFYQRSTVAMVLRRVQTERGLGRGAGTAHGDLRPRGRTTRADPGDGAYRLGKDDDPGHDDRPHQPDAPMSHRHHRGSHRVPPPRPGRLGGATRSRLRHRFLRQRHARGAPAGPRRDPRRGDAGHRNCRALPCPRPRLVTWCSAPSTPSTSPRRSTA